MRSQDDFYGGVWNKDGELIITGVEDGDLFRVKRQENAFLANGIELAQMFKTYQRDKFEEAKANGLWNRFRK